MIVIGATVAGTILYKRRKATEKPKEELKPLIEAIE
jgi:hypothetical protein